MRGRRGVDGLARGWGGKRGRQQEQEQEQEQDQGQEQEQEQAQKLEPDSEQAKK